MPPQSRGTGTVGIGAEEAGRFTEFALSLGRLDLPAGWEIMGAMNYDLAHSRNGLIDQFRGEFLFFLDDDHVFAPNLLKRLLRHNLDIVGALCLQRRPPFAPCPRVNGAQLVLEGEPGLVQVDELGGSGLLVRRSVFEAMERPWFLSGTQADGSHMMDETYFSLRAREAGFKLFVDTGAVLTHTTLAHVTPRFDGSRWSREIAVGGMTINLDGGTQ